MPTFDVPIINKKLSISLKASTGLTVKASPLPMSTLSGGSVFGGTGRYPWFGRMLPGTKLDYQAMAGDKWKNAVVSAGVSWVGRNLPYAPLKVYEYDDVGKDKYVKHPLEQILRKPNRFYDGKTLLQATFISLIAGNGNAFWWVKRTNTGLPLELWYLRHDQVWPLWDQFATTEDWISGYAYRNAGITYILNNDDIIHFRDGLDPDFTRMGLDPLKAMSRELVTDNDASGYAAQLLDNLCMPGAIISPNSDAIFDKTDAEELKDQFEESTGGDNKFRPIVMTSSVKIDKMALTPKEMMLDSIQHQPEARICAAMGISPMVLGLEAGLKHSTYSNMETAEAAAWHNCIMPRIGLICSELDTQVLSYYPNGDNIHVAGDYDNVPALQENKESQFKSVSLVVGGPILTPNEARNMLGYIDIAGGEALYPPQGTNPQDSFSGATQTKPAGNPNTAIGNK